MSAPQPRQIKENVPSRPCRPAQRPGARAPLWFRLDAESPPGVPPVNETQPNPRRARLARAEALLDRWLDLFEGALAEARPDPSKTTELANVFTILKRLEEIDALRARTAAREGANHDDATPPFRMDPNLFPLGTEEPAGDDD